MGREIQRVPLDFDWPIGQTWLAYTVGPRFPTCHVCGGDGYSATAKNMRDDLRAGRAPWPDGIQVYDTHRALVAVVPEADITCRRCEGNGDIATPELREWGEAQPSTPLPKGAGWQLWETVGDSPMSPVFATSEALVEWMTTNPWRLNMGAGPSLLPSDRATAEAFVAKGWAPSFATFRDASGVTITDGVDLVTKATTS